MTDHQLYYWQQTLAGLEPLELPTDRRRPTTEGAADRDAITFAIPADVHGRLAKLAAGRDARLSTALLSVLQVLLSRYSGQDDIAVGTPAAEADFPATGGSSDTLIIRTDLSDDPTFTELLDRVVRTAAAADEHGGLPFARLVEEFDAACELSRTPMFAMPAAGHEAAPTALHNRPADGDGTDLRLTVVELSGGGLRGAVEFRTDLFERATVERLA
ncbi:condensation domain-containing protein, partial [Embleya sp. NPDC005575]|uniref:condensation domain-containing protein n=1 Tax=Embleya sp. NPDC005575 TaxID=3156892 RepID=UPI00339F5CAA